MKGYSNMNYSNLKKSFWEDGYLIIKSFFSDKEMEDYNYELKSIIKSYLKKNNINKNINNYFDEGIFQLEKDKHENIAALYDTIFQIPSFLRIIGKIEIQEVINSLLGKNLKDPLYGFTQRCRIDPPNDSKRTYGWHQEVFYTLPKSQFLQTWAPLIRDTTISNGTIEICKGSHKSDIPHQDWNEKKGYATQIIVDKKEVAKYPKVKVEMEVGDILIFTGKTFHRSGNNTSDEVRYSLVGMYHDIDNLDFIAPKPEFTYRSITPRIYYEKIINSKK